MAMGLNVRKVMREHLVVDQEHKPTVEFFCNVLEVFLRWSTQYRNCVVLPVHDGL